MNARRRPPVAPRPDRFPAAPPMAQCRKRWPPQPVWPAMGWRRTAGRWGKGGGWGEAGGPRRGGGAAAGRWGRRLRLALSDAWVLSQQPRWGSSHLSALAFGLAPTRELVPAACSPPRRAHTLPQRRQ